MKEIIIGQKFRLPRIADLSKWKALVKIVNYNEDGDYCYVVKEGNEIASLKALDKLFQGFSLVANCSQCCSKFPITGEMDLAVYNGHKEEHYQKLSSEIAELNKVLLNIYCEEYFKLLIIMREYFESHRRRCNYCYGKLHGLYLTFYGIQYQCQICGAKTFKELGKTWDEAEKNTDELSYHIKMRGFRYVFNQH